MSEPLDRLKFLVYELPEKLVTSWDASQMETALSGIEDALNEIIDPSREHFADSIETILEDFSTEYGLHPEFPSWVSGLAEACNDLEYGELRNSYDVCDVLIDVQGQFEKLIEKLKER